MTEQNGIADIQKYRLRRRRAMKARLVLALVFFLACMVAGYFFSCSAVFSVREITVEGCDVVDEERVLSLAGYATGMNLFAVDPEQMEMWVCIEPKIATAEVKRVWPDRIRITVTERQPIAMMSAGTAMIEIDGSGKVLSRYRTIESLDLPLISGVDLRNQGSVPGALIDAEGMEDALAIMNCIPADAVNIGEVDVSDPQSIILYTANGTEIRLGDNSDFDKKYHVYNVILSDYAEAGEGIIEYIDVSYYDDPVIKYH